MIIVKIAFCIAAAGAAGYVALTRDTPAQQAPATAVQHHPPMVDLGRLVDSFRR